MDGVIDRGACEFVYDVSGKMPTTILCEMMNIPEADRGFVLKVGDDILNAADPRVSQGQSPAQFADAARARFRDYCMKLVDERRRRPGDDILSDLGNGRVGDRPMTDDEIIANALNLVIAGQETTRNTAAGAVLLMIENKAVRDFFESDPGSATAVEEVLRFLSPALHVKREALRDTEIKGQKIKAGEKVVLWNISANRDEDEFKNPDHFDPRRTPNLHLSFGFGPHVCLGGYLARLELRLLFEHMLRRIHAFELTGPVERVSSNFVYGLKKVPVRFKRR